MNAYCSHHVIHSHRLRRRGLVVVVVVVRWKEIRNKLTLTSVIT